ncbi:MAG: thiamine-phosphate pyrophosphorylase [Campylobacteraceae bacterium]|jgi:thiamine-phosphate pyrophosphorylase|nr:thiamine-phosphate pyrophosphorylase [Campylobacteraceae bacterium]
MSEPLEELQTPLLRLLDANLNRLREGVRVVEDIRRYCFDDKNIAKTLKGLRHKARLEPYQTLLHSRDIENDVLKFTIKSESSRENLISVQIANLKRAQESARVLEETLKLYDIKEAQIFKEIRYSLYAIEKKICL